MLTSPTKMLSTAISSPEDMKTAAMKMPINLRGSVLVKGGYSPNDANDFFYSRENCAWINGERIDNPNTYGTGCTLSSSIASNMAKGYTLLESVKLAKAYITGALEAKLNLGKGSGPLDHCYIIGEYPTPY